MNLPEIKQVLGNRIIIRRAPEQAAGVIQAPETAEAREPYFEADVLKVGARLTEDLRPGHRILCGAHPSQDRVGTRKVLWRGKPAELLSVLDVVAIYEPL